MNSNNNPLDPKYVEKKLQSLSNTRESIQTISMWALSHKAQHEQIVSIWFQVLKTANIELRLCLFYVCNDIVQMCRREHAVVFKDAFKEVLKDAALLVRDASVRTSVKRIFKIWLERKIYDEAFVKELLATLNNTKVKSSLSSKLLAGFHPENLKKSIIKMINLEELSEIQQSKMPHYVWSREEINAQKHEMKNRNQGAEVIKQIEEMRAEYRKYVGHLEKEKSQRKELILMLELSELFYDAQLGECNILTTAYKAYSTKLNSVKRRLRELKHPKDQDLERLTKKRRRSIEKEGGTTNEGGDLPSGFPGNNIILRDGTDPGIAHTYPPPPPPPPSILTPPLRPELWSNPVVMATMSEVQQFPIVHSSNQLNVEAKFYHRMLQGQYCAASTTTCQQQSRSYASTSMTFVAPVATFDDCYEANRYEIGGEECTPVYDEDALNSGNTTPVQDEDPVDGYVSSKQQKGTYPVVQPAVGSPPSGFSIGSSLAPGKKLSTPCVGAPSSHGGYPLQYVHPTPDLTRPPPPLNLFYSPSSVSSFPGMGNDGDKEKGHSDSSQGFHLQVMQMSSGMYPVVPIPSSIASPTQFGMIPFVSSSLPTQQQLAHTQPNFSHLPSIGVNSLVPQLAMPSPTLPFQQRRVMSPSVTASIQTLLQPNQKSAWPSSLTPSLSPHERSDASFQSSVSESKDHGGPSLQPTSEGVSTDEDSAGKRRTRVRFNNLAHARTLETRRAETNYDSHIN